MEREAFRRQAPGGALRTMNGSGRSRSPICWSWRFVHVSGGTGGTSLNVAELASELEPESRFTVRMRYLVQIRASKGQPRSPVVMVAFPAAPYPLRVTGPPVNERLHVLDVGRHFVSGASELWFSSPRWANDKEMEVVVEAG